LEEEWELSEQAVVWDIGLTRAWG